MCTSRNPTCDTREQDCDERPEIASHSSLTSTRLCVWSELSYPLMPAKDRGKELQ
jgi:hypothetical protein